MPANRKYATAGAFRQALEERLKTMSRDGRTDFQRLCRQVAFDRFLARLARVDSPDWILKGGYAMELRFDTARSTRDLDFTLRKGNNDAGGKTGQPDLRSFLLEDRGSGNRAEPTSDAISLELKPQTGRAKAQPLVVGASRIQRYRQSLRRRSTSPLTTSRTVQTECAGRIREPPRVRLSLEFLLRALIPS